MKTVAALALSIMVAVLMFAPSVHAGTTNTVTVSDAKDDLRMATWANMRGKGAYHNIFGDRLGNFWPANSPVGKADYLDVREASISKQEDTFVVTMTMWCDDLNAEVEMPIGKQDKQIAYIFIWKNLDTGTVYGVHFEWLNSKWDTWGNIWFDGVPTQWVDFTWSVTGATITLCFNKNQIGNPSSIAWGYEVLIDIYFTSGRDPYHVGGCFFVDFPDSFTSGGSFWATWPAP